MTHEEETARNPRATRSEDRGMPARVPAPDERCPLDTVLGYLHSAWAIRILWWLARGPRRFGELRRLLGPISAKVLVERLRRMEQQGMVARRSLPTSPVQVEYSIAPLGARFVPVLETMEKVGAALARSRP